MHFQIAATVTAIHIHIGVWVHHGVIKCCVKNSFLQIGATFHFNFSQFFIPSGFCVFTNFIKIPSWHFSFEVKPGSIFANSRNAYF